MLEVLSNIILATLAAVGLVHLTQAPQRLFRFWQDFQVFKMKRQDPVGYMAYWQRTEIPTATNQPIGRAFFMCLDCGEVGLCMKPVPTPPDFQPCPECAKATVGGVG